MVTAKLRYRDYIGYNANAAGIKVISFYCQNYNIETELEELEYLLAYKRYDEQKALEEYYEKYRTPYIKKLDSLKAELEELKKKYKLGTRIFLVKDKIKSLKLETKKVLNTISVIDKVYKSKKQHEFHNVDEEVEIFKNILTELSFTCKSRIYRSENVISEEIYECNLPDNEIIKLIQKCYNREENKLNREIEDIIYNFKREVESKLGKQNDGASLE